jgi:hypothetical protein
MEKSTGPPTSPLAVDNEQAARTPMDDESLASLGSNYTAKTAPGMRLTQIEPTAKDDASLMTTETDANERSSEQASEASSTDDLMKDGYGPKTPEASDDLSTSTDNTSNMTSTATTGAGLKTTGMDSVFDTSPPSTPMDMDGPPRKRTYSSQRKKKKKSKSKSPNKPQNRSRSKQPKRPPPPGKGA